MTADFSNPGRLKRRLGQHRSWIALVAATFFCIAHSAVAQLIGTDICGCQPQTYTFTLDFDLTCDDSNVAGPGINETACLTEIRGQDVVPDEDLVPVTVQTIQIFELDQNLKVFSQTVRSGTFVNGSNFTYTSIISTITDLEDFDSLPRGLQLVMTGVNRKEQPTTQTWIITYFNDCGIFPILDEGEREGWTIFSELGDPPTALCPLVPSTAPTTDSPVGAAPSHSPTEAPSVAPITPDSPTRSPIVTNVPVTEPPVTDAPIDTETTMPSCPPIGDGGKGKGKGKGGKGEDSGKGVNGKGGKGGKGEDSGKGMNGKGGKGGKGDDEGGKGKGGSDGLRKKETEYGQMDRFKDGDTEDRLLATGGGGGVECPEYPDDDYYAGKGKGKGNDGKNGKGKGGKGDSDSMGGKGKGGKGGMGKGDDDSSGKGKGSDLMKKPKDISKSMDMNQTSKGKGKGKGGDDDKKEGKGKGGGTSSYYDDHGSKNGKGKGADTDDDEDDDSYSSKNGKGKGAEV